MSLGQTPRVRAPELNADAWLNTDKPLKIADLRGQVVLLDFWTYCCINCMHVFPDLKALEEKYAGKPFVVIGVHSGKFSQEHDAANIRQAILRHNLEHRVAVDSDYDIWKAYTVPAWPSFVLIDPEGYVVMTASGEGQRAKLDRAIGNLLERYEREGKLAKPMKFKLERDAEEDHTLAFPGKVLVNDISRRIFISDTNHNRVLMTDLEGNVLAVIGSGEIGLKDGVFKDAQFHQPQGLALSGDGRRLFVADTENHAVREVDLKLDRVRTLAGNGKQAGFHDEGGVGRAARLSSPWDLALAGDKLYIAMAGNHQIWSYDLKTRRVTRFAGTGNEAGIDGPNEQAAFAQPSGLATDGRVLYVADAEISSIRRVELSGSGKTTTLAGSADLFGWGAQNGRGSAARFQHPLGVALAGDDLYVADTFNHLIRLITVNNGVVSTWLGTGKTDLGTPEKPGLYEPGGISVGGRKVYIADTNHHRILVADIDTHAVEELRVRLPAPSR